MGETETKPLIRKPALEGRDVASPHSTAGLSWHLELGQAHLAALSLLAHPLWVLFSFLGSASSPVPNESLCTPGWWGWSFGLWAIWVSGSGPQRLWVMALVPQWLCCSISDLCSWGNAWSFWRHSSAGFPDDGHVLFLWYHPPTKSCHGFLLGPKSSCPSQLLPQVASPVPSCRGSDPKFPSQAAEVTEDLERALHSQTRVRPRSERQVPAQALVGQDVLATASQRGRCHVPANTSPSACRSCTAPAGQRGRSILNSRHNYCVKKPCKPARSPLATGTLKGLCHSPVKTSFRQ